MRTQRDAWHGSEPWRPPRSHPGSSSPALCLLWCTRSPSRGSIPGRDAGKHLDGSWRDAGSCREFANSPQRPPAPGRRHPRHPAGLENPPGASPGAPRAQPASSAPGPRPLVMPPPRPPRHEPPRQQDGHRRGPMVVPALTGPGASQAPRRDRVFYQRASGAALQRDNTPSATAGSSKPLPGLPKANRGASQRDWGRRPGSEPCQEPAMLPADAGTGRGGPRRTDPAR